MSAKPKPVQFVVCDDNQHNRRLVADVLAGHGYEKVQFAIDGRHLLELTSEFQPNIIITSSRVPGLSGLDFTRKIRSGLGSVSRVTSIIVMTDTPTQKFLDAARDAGVDEMLARPFTGDALLARVEAVLLRPRRFVESFNYVGPCRRRRMVDDYNGPMRRFTDPLEDNARPLWEAETNRELVRQTITKISELARDLDPEDRRKLREVYAAVRDAEQLADDVKDEAMGDSARSLQRYISAVGATGMLDSEVITTHIDAMQQLGMLGSKYPKERSQLVQGLHAVVDKRLRNRKPAA